MENIAHLPDREMDYSKQMKLLRKRFIPSYKNRLRTLILLCRQNQIEPLFLTQPALYGKGIDPITGANLESISVQGEPGVLKWKKLELYNQTTLFIGKEHRVFTVDLAQKMPKSSEYFYDFIHFNLKGAKKIAEILYPILKDQFGKKGFNG